MITAAHGVRGEVRVRALTEDASALDAYGPVTDSAGRRFDLRIVRVTNRGVICRLNGVGDRNAAEALAGTDLFVDADRLPPAEADEWYVDDLIGLQAVDTAGTPLGIVRLVNDFGAGDVVEIETPDGKDLVLPFTSDVFPEVAPEQGRVVVQMPDFLEAKTPSDRATATAETEGGR